MLPRASVATWYGHAGIPRAFASCRSHVHATNSAIVRSSSICIAHGRSIATVRKPNGPCAIATVVDQPVKPRNTPMRRSRRMEGLCVREVMFAITCEVMPSPSFGPLLKRWRQARRLSQEQLSADAEISTRHLSFLENGKSKPSREMVLLLSSALELDLRDRNALLHVAGFAPAYASTGLESLRMAPVKRAVELMLKQQEPYGAVLVDRVWNVLQMNEGAQRMMARFFPAEPPPPEIAANVIKATLHPKGLRPVLVNWVEVAVFTLERLDRECAMFPHDAERQKLRDEVKKYPGLSALTLPTEPSTDAPAALVHLKKGKDEIRLFTMVTTLGTPLDITAQELAIESYFPADDATEAWLRKLA